MPFLITLLVIALIVAFLFLSTLFIVPQQQAYIIERFGKFNKVQFAGIHIRIPFVDRIAMKTNMRVNQLNVQLETKTLDNVFVTVVASTQFRVDPSNVATAYYELRDPAGQLRSYMEDALRSAIPALSLDDAFSRKDDVAFDVQKTVGNEMSRFGFTVVKTLITAIDPSPQVKNAMDSINAAQREKEATRQRAEAQRIQIETQAAAEAEKTRLQGEGQANYRREIANGIVDQIKSLQAVGMNVNDARTLLVQRKLGLGSQTEQYSDQPVGSIISQNPGEGASAKLNTRVSVVVSAGPEPAPEPEAPSESTASSDGSGGWLGGLFGGSSSSSESTGASSSSSTGGGLSDWWTSWLG